MEMAKIKGTIYYKMAKAHPDIEYIDPMLANNVMVYSDTYQFKSYYDEDFIRNYITNDLKLIAGGGYNFNHIYNITVKIERVKDNASK